jgi:hypothetical protein
LTGIYGRCEEGDFIVEFFNRLLEDVVQHKSAQFDDLFIRNIISRNLRHIAELKLAWRTGVGMKKKAARHCNPHTNLEMITLLKLYRETELHSRRLGRQIDDRDTDDFAKGVKKLRDGGLQNTLARLAANRQVFHSDTPTPPPVSEPVVASDDDAGSDSDEEDTSSDSARMKKTHRLTLPASLTRNRMKPQRKGSMQRGDPPIFWMASWYSMTVICSSDRTMGRTQMRR